MPGPKCALCKGSEQDHHRASRQSPPAQAQQSQRRDSHERREGKCAAHMIGCSEQPPPAQSDDLSPEGSPHGPTLGRCAAAREPLRIPSGTSSIFQPPRDRRDPLAAHKLPHFQLPLHRGFGRCPRGASRVSGRAAPDDAPKLSPSDGTASVTPNSHSAVGWCLLRRRRPPSCAAAATALTVISFQSRHEIGSIFGSGRMRQDPTGWHRAGRR